MNDAHPLFVDAEEGRDFLYEMRCPECGSDETQFGKVLVSQNGLVTAIDRRGETVHEEDTSSLPGALVTLICDCAAGHSFCAAFLHGEEGIRVYAARVGESSSEPLWINPEPAL